MKKKKKEVGEYKTIKYFSICCKAKLSRNAALALLCEFIEIIHFLFQPKSFNFNVPLSDYFDLSLHVTFLYIFPHKFIKKERKLKFVFKIFICVGD